VHTRGTDSRLVFARDDLCDRHCKQKYCTVSFEIEHVPLNGRIEMNALNLGIKRLKFKVTVMK